MTRQLSDSRALRQFTHLARSLHPVHTCGKGERAPIEDAGTRQRRIAKAISMLSGSWLVVCTPFGLHYFAQLAMLAVVLG